MSITNGEGNINSGYAQWELPEFVVAVYFSALGVGAPGVKDLIAHKCNKIVTESAIECQVEHAKSSRPNIYDYAARLWRLGKLGKYLKDIMDDGNFFEYLIQWGTEEEVMVSVSLESF